jgi:hypothetical protein
MLLEVTHTEFSHSTPDLVWKLWSDVSTWIKWDHGLEWCKLKDGHQFQLHAEASLLPKGAPQPVNIKIIECEPNKKFTDEAKFELGTLQAFHEIFPQKEGVNIKHSLKYIPANPHARAIFEKHMWPNLQRGLPESVKALAGLASEVSAKLKTSRLPG